VARVQVSASTGTNGLRHAPHHARRHEHGYKCCLCAYAAAPHLLFDMQTVCRASCVVIHAGDTAKLLEQRYGKLEVIFDEGGLILSDGYPPMTTRPVALVMTSEKSYVSAKVGKRCKLLAHTPAAMCMRCCQI
jgi:hypothetical protein